MVCSVFHVAFMLQKKKQRHGASSEEATSAIPHTMVMQRGETKVDNKVSLHQSMCNIIT